MADSKTEKDIFGAVSLLADMFGGEGTADAIRQATNVAKSATDAIPRGRRSKDSEKSDHEDDGAVDMTECQECGTFYTGEKCGGCGWEPIAPPPPPEPHTRSEARYYVTFDRTGKQLERYVSPHQACEHAYKIKGYVRVLHTSELK
jgi:hypothetical protein